MELYIFHRKIKMTTKLKKAQTQSKFYVVKNVKETQKKIEDRVKIYNEKFVKKQISNSKEFITELKKHPVKRIDEIIDDSKNAIKKTRDEQYFTSIQLAAAGTKTPCMPNLWI